jgi:hypothetical protein
MACFSGLSVASAELLLKKVEIVDFIPANASPMQQFLVRGRTDATNDWQEKIYQMVKGQAEMLTFTEGDLNVLMRQSVDSKSDGVKATPNLRIVDNRMQLGMIIHFPQIPHPVCMQSTGVFQSTPEGYSFVPQRTYMGSLPLPSWLAKKLLQSIFSRITASEQSAPMVKAWKSAKYISFKDNKLLMDWSL